MWRCGRIPTQWFIIAITPWSRVVLENLIVTQLVKKFPAFYGIPQFITVFT
jgi:hypothetical protein